MYLLIFQQSLDYRGARDQEQSYVGLSSCMIMRLPIAAPKTIQKQVVCTLQWACLADGVHMPFYDRPTG